MGGTWDLDPEFFLFRVFFLDFFVLWGLVLADRSPPWEWTSFPPLVTAVLITAKGAEPEVADSVTARDCPQKTADIDGLRYSRDDPHHGPGVHTSLYMQVTWDWWLGHLPRSPERARAETSGTDRWVSKRRELPGVAIVNEKKRPHPRDTHHQFSIKLYSQREGWIEEQGGMERIRG